MRRTLIVLILTFIVFLGSPLVFQPFSNVEMKTYIYHFQRICYNNGDTDQILKPSLRTFSIFMNTSWQTTYLETTTNSDILHRDDDGNPIIVLNTSPLPPGGNVSLSYSLRLEEQPRHPPDINFASSGTLSGIPETLRQQYCKFEGTWLVTEELQSLAITIWRAQNMTPNVLRIVTSVANWIGNNVQSVTHDVPYYPNETYSSLEGDCDDQANLLIALCRILGIPAYLQIGCLRWFSSIDTHWEGHVMSNRRSISYHGWAIVYIPPWGWLPLDMTLGWSPINQLSVIESARVWNQDTMPIANIIQSDWAGEGQALKTSILASSLVIYEEHELVPQDQGITILADRHLLSFITVASFFSIITWFLFKRFNGY